MKRRRRLAIRRAHGHAAERRAVREEKEAGRVGARMAPGRPRRFVDNIFKAVVKAVFGIGKGEGG